MIFQKKSIWACTGFCLFSLSLSGCSNNSTEDLQSYAEQVKSTQQAQIEPLPEFSPYETYLYQAAGARDPFSKPNYAEPTTEIAKTSTSDLIPDFNRSRETLETEPLDSLRMVGTLERGGSAWALIQMSDATIHRVNPGNYLGQNHGKIVAVSESTIEVTEIVPDGLGGWMERQAALALSE